MDIGNMKVLVSTYLKASEVALLKDQAVEQGISFSKVVAEHVRASMEAQAKPISVVGRSKKVV